MERLYEPSSALSWLARAAILLADHPSALRVLCIVAEHMGEGTTCSISQSHIAKRLGISRQATSKHLGLLDRSNILTSKLEKVGLLKKYSRPLNGVVNGD